MGHACPRWLLFVEGVSHTTASGAPAAGPKQSDYGHNWASNLEGVRARPLTLPADAAGKLVYSPHIYGPSVAPQPYFDAPEFPHNMEAIWDAHFGFIAAERRGCVAVGEWGGWNMANDAVWQRAFSAYLSRRQISHFYWALNPTSRNAARPNTAPMPAADPSRVPLTERASAFVGRRRHGGARSRRLAHAQQPEADDARRDAGNSRIGAGRQRG